MNLNLPSIYQQLELVQAALGHAIYFLEIEATERAVQHVKFAQEQLEHLPKSMF